MHPRETAVTVRLPPLITKGITKRTSNLDPDIRLDPQAVLFLRGMPAAVRERPMVYLVHIIAG